MLDKNRLRDDRTHAAGTKEASERHNEMNEKDNQVAHPLILTKPGIPLGLCHELAIRQGQGPTPFVCIELVAFGSAKVLQGADISVSYPA